jgi:kynurenine formamidase
LKLIDLSHPLEHGQLNFPWDPKISILSHNTVSSIGYNITEISMSSHQGTHLDAPFHFYDDGKTIDQVQLDRFYGPATLIDLAPNSYLEAKTPLKVEMFEPWEDKFQEGAKIIYRTGWDRMFGKPEFFSDFPTLTLDSARWIAEHRIGLLGMDTPTPSTDWNECHLILLKKGVEIVIVEGLTNLNKMPEQFTFIGFPLYIKGRDGSPIRAVALAEQRRKENERA